MNDEEIRSNIEQIKAQVKAKPENQGKSEDEIDELVLDSFFKAFTEGKLSKEDLENLAGAMGYEFSEEFAAEEQAPTNPTEGAETSGQTEASEATKEDLQATLEPGEGKEELEEKLDNVEGEAGDEEEERQEASKLWKMDLTK